MPWARQEQLVVRKSGRETGRLADVPLPPRVKLDRDVVEILLEDRYSGR